MLGSSIGPRMTQLSSHLLLHLWVLTSLGHLLTLVVSFYVLLLVFVDPLHILNHLFVTRRYHISVLILHHIVAILGTHALSFLSLIASSSLLLLEKGHVEL